MAKEFNTTGTCNPEKHYMVDTTLKMQKFERLIDGGSYFTITRARQFGKSTSLNWIYYNLSDRYLVIPISFENTSAKNWIDDRAFFEYFCENMATIDCGNKSANEFWNKAKASEVDDFKAFSLKIVEFCTFINKKVVLTIDEVDKSLDNQLFMNFLSMLRNLYLERERTRNYNSTFWSVVLAGVYDIKNLKVKIRPDEEHRYNSPWNIAANYKLEMAFNPQEISTMLADYENDYHIGFNIMEIAEEIYKYTSGYPVLVSSVCKEIDEYLDKDWTTDGIQKAAKSIIADTSSTLQFDIIKNIETYPDVKKLLRAILLEKFKINYLSKTSDVEFCRMFSLIGPDENSYAQIHNLIFQQILYNYFIDTNELSKLSGDSGIRVFITKDGDLNMPLIIKRFQNLMRNRNKDDKFIEREGRFMFICFLKPIINGTGFYYSEPENDDGSRMDLVVTYNHKKYIIELKIWHGTEYEISGRQQLSECLDKRGLQEGYLVTFSFLKEKIIQEQPEWIEYDGKRIYEAVV